MGCVGSTVANASPRRLPSSRPDFGSVESKVHPMMPKTSTVVVVPLYIYPLPGAWEPLYEGISSHPHISFLIILNPHDGPGIDSNLPDAAYSTEIAKLNAFPNITTVGYVRIDYCKRALESVREDIEKYAHWSTVGMGIHGIFFDETPCLRSPHAIDYLTGINQIVKADQGILGDRFIIHNPGTIPNADLVLGLQQRHALPDLTAVVEDSFANYASAPFQQRLGRLCQPPHFVRHNTCYILHSVPRESQAALVRNISRRTQYIFLTDRCADFYEALGPGWIDFLDAVGP